MRENARSGKIEFGDSLVQAVAPAEVDVGAQLLRVRRARARSRRSTPVLRARRRDERRKDSVRARRANRLLVLRLGAIDRQREARAIPHERAVDRSMRTAASAPDGRSPENALRAFIESSRMFMLKELRHRPLPGRVRTSMRGPPLPLPEASS